LAEVRVLFIPRETLLANNFQKPKYRPDKMGTIGGKTYWNDSKSTNFGALDGALKNCPREKVIWIGGGQSNGDNLGGIVRILKGHPKWFGRA
jgi:UDP-N-acetylmuramoylalanine-D-glutamate ligase